mmetsp:Transcript_146290/g.469238  ORF Transcript_146290/g.469238 Transcript_146290/m.469238 type:complete len:401 (+) Transcript_146290:135-1337(+)
MRCPCALRCDVVFAQAHRMLDPVDLHDLPPMLLRGLAVQHDDLAVPELEAQPAARARERGGELPEVAHRHSVEGLQDGVHGPLDLLGGVIEVSVRAKSMAQHEHLLIDGGSSAFLDHVHHEGRCVAVKIFAVLALQVGLRQRYEDEPAHEEILSGAGRTRHQRTGGPQREIQAQAFAIPPGLELAHVLGMPPAHQIRQVHPLSAPACGQRHSAIVADVHAVDAQDNVVHVQGGVRRRRRVDVAHADAPLLTRGQPEGGPGRRALEGLVLEARVANAALVIEERTHHLRGYHVADVVNLLAGHLFESDAHTATRLVQHGAAAVAGVDRGVDLQHEQLHVVGVEAHVDARHDTLRDADVVAVARVADHSDFFLQGRQGVVEFHLLQVHPKVVGINCKQSQVL